MIAVCITSRNRLKVLLESLDNHVKFLPDGAGLFFVDDASDVPFGFAEPPHYLKAHYRFESNVGVARAKNKCLEMAQAWGADHIFLFDDDTYPIVRSWEKPYIEHKEPHLMYQFKLPGKPLTDMRELYRDDETVAYSHTRGAMLYIERRVLDVVGGFDTAYGKGGYEHPDWTNRIHNAGLTTHRAMDVPNSSRLLHCLDQDGKIRSSIEPQAKAQRMVINHRLYVKNKNSSAFKDYR